MTEQQTKQWATLYALTNFGMPTNKITRWHGDKKAQVQFHNSVAAACSLVPCGSFATSLNQIRS